MSFYRALAADPDLLGIGWDLSDTLKFIKLALYLKPYIASTMRIANLDTPPPHLPVNIHDFFKLAIGLADEEVKIAWDGFRAAIWESALGGDTDDDPITAFSKVSEYTEDFIDFGLARFVGAINLFPPTRICEDEGCARSYKTGGYLQAQGLTDERTFRVTVFTQAYGPLPGFASSLECPNCRRRYYHNYIVHKGDSFRTYYAGYSLSLIQINEHVYVERVVCESFATMMSTAWVSATNCARNYTLSTKRTPNLPIDWSHLELDVDDVWNAFFLHTLLNQHEERGRTLVLPHKGHTQRERLLVTIQDENARTVGTGQEHWNHVCDKCCWVYEKEGLQYELRSVVVDGVTVGHPCCSAHDCPIPLESSRDRYCPAHTHLSSLCVAISCNETAEANFKTCTDPDHRNLETRYNMAAKAMFQLRHRLERVNRQTHDSLPTDFASDGDSNDFEGSSGRDDQEVEVTADDCNGKPSSGNRTIRARFGRRRTHNDELCVASCGIILGRKTFYGSEAPSAVRAFLMELFPTQRSLPGVIWYDNNCKLYSMLQNDEDPYLRHYFDRCALPVDVFHFKMKHKESDIDCGKNCNPYKWPELRINDKEWRFNSSAAEQVNAWYGRFQAIVREMQVDRYNFFLNEMVKRRNRLVVEDLRRKGLQPCSYSRGHLLSI